MTMAIEPSYKILFWSRTRRKIRKKKRKSRKGSRRRGGRRGKEEEGRKRREGRGGKEKEEDKERRRTSRGQDYHSKAFKLVNTTSPWLCQSAQ